MSANLIVDFGNNVLGGLSINPTVASAPTSGVHIGLPVSLKHANSLTNVFVGGGANSGVLIVQVQTAEGSGLLQSGGGFPASGAFTDPTSGLADFPGPIKSGGVLYINSGLVSLPGGGGASGGMNVNTFAAGTHNNWNNQLGGWVTTSGTSTVFGSGGGIAFGNFQRPNEWCRLNILSTASGFTGFTFGGFFGQMKTTGSGGGYTTSPTSGVVNV